MHHTYHPLSGYVSQDGSSASPLSINSLYKQRVGSMIDGWMQSIENRLSHWFWQGINSLPKSYFSKEITAVNYQDKLLWEGIFNDRIEWLKEQLDTGWLSPSATQQNNINSKEGAKLDKLKEQTAAGFLQEDISLENYLIQLQGIVGKNMLSPQCYETGLTCLKQSISQSYAPPIIEKIRCNFRAELKKQPEFLAECFQGDVFDLFKQNQPLTRTNLQQILDYYQPLMKHKHYVKHRDWLKSCYSKQSLLPPPSINRPLYQQPPEKTVPTKKNESSYWYSIGNISKFLWEHTGKLMTFGLAVQVAAVQAASAGTARSNFIPEGNSTNQLAYFPALDEVNQTFVNDTILYLGNNTDFKYDLDRLLKIDLESSIREEFNQIILDQFDQINVCLENMVNDNKLSSQSEVTEGYFLFRNSRIESPLGRRSNCTVTKDTLSELLRTVNDTLSNNGRSQVSSCELSNHISDNCDELIKAIQCGVSHLKTAFSKSVVSNNVSDEFKNTLYNAIEKYKRELDNQRAYFKENYGIRADKLQKEIHSLIEKFNHAQKEIQEISPEVLAIRIIKGGESLESAVDKFKELFKAKISYEPLINKTVEHAYGLEHIENILIFIGKLPWYSHRGIGFNKLYEKMKDHRHLGSPNVIIFYDKVQETLNINNIPAVKQQFDHIFHGLSNKLIIQVNNIIDAWAVRVSSNNDYKQIYDFNKKYSDIFIKHLGLIVEKSYVCNSNTIENILIFTSGLINITDDIVSLSSLLGKMKNNNCLDNVQLLVLAYRAKTLMEMNNYPYILKNYNDKLETLKNNLPLSVRRLIWNRNTCNIRNKYYNEYLYAANNELAYDVSRRRVFTWRPGNDVTQDNWLFNPVNQAKSFNIKNNFQNEYLYAANNELAYDVSRRRVFTWRPGNDVTQNNWKLIPKNGYFYIYNIYYNEYLYAAEYATYDRERRRVFTWREGGDDGGDIRFMWKIIC